MAKVIEDETLGGASMGTGALPRSFEASTLCGAFQITAAQRPEAVALRTPGGGVEISWAEYAERVRRIAGGLAALGVGRGDTVALMMTNRPEFNLVDTAAMHLGAAPFSVYNTSAADQISYLFSNADNRGRRLRAPVPRRHPRGGGSVGRACGRHRRRGRGHCPARRSRSRK